MSTVVKSDTAQTPLERIITLLEKGSLYEIRTLIHSLYPAETARIIEALDIEDRGKIWRVIPPSVMGELLTKLHVEVAAGLIRITDRKDLIRATESLAAEDRLDFLHTLPEPLLSQVLDSINASERRRLESALAYAEDSAGGIMSLNVLTIRADVSLEVVLRYVRKRAGALAGTDSLIVVDRHNYYQGLLHITDLLTKDAGLKVAQVMDTSVTAIAYQMPTNQVALLFEQRELRSAPVVNGSGILLGKITLENVIPLIRAEAGHSFMSMAGLTEEQDIFAPVITSARRRAVWLGINLCTAFLASWVIGLFEATLDQIVALAVLMPIVASMGGIAGSQTLTLVIRGLALKQVSAANANRLLLKELSVGAANGILWAIVVAVIAGVWFDSSSIGILLGSAMVINLICAALAGATIPLALSKIGIDPALAGGVLLTTVTDVVGFMAFLGLATVFLL
jgi:magnesium transporter